MADRRWSDEELKALVKAWRWLYNRRRRGETDVWLPANQRSLVRSTRALVSEDWRAVATAVNSFRTHNHLYPIRTDRQCKRRVELLKSQFGQRQLATPSWMGFVPAVGCNSTTGGRGRRHSKLCELATAALEAHGGDDCCGGDGGGSAAVAENGGVVMGAAASTENAGDDGVAVEVEEGGTATPPPSSPADRFAAGVFLDGLIPKKRRTGASTSVSADAGDGPAPSVKEELVRGMNARRAHVDEGRAAAGGFAATALEMASALAEVLATESNDVAVVAKLSEMFMGTTTLYMELSMKRIELQRQMLAAITGGAAVVEPDAAHA